MELRKVIKRALELEEGKGIGVAQGERASELKKKKNTKWDRHWLKRERYK